MIKLSIKERREQFQFLLALFVATVFLLCFGIFYSTKTRHEISKIELEEKVREDLEFEEVTKSTRPIIDTTYTQIVHFNPNVRAVFLKTDLLSAIASIKSAYERKAADSRYKTFLQTAQLYNILFYGRLEQKGNLIDAEGLKKSLDDCVLSRRQLQQTLAAPQPR
ncbi:type VI secretion system TssO [Pedobacter duraquae]|uniref:Type VI secretion system transmembrane protein TssO n=1 Tax=Pedobacter duraquae TaxID=425511 RepID=A0A4R6IR79_9SPHI|nr:type VI secretion system TssO [Pedobacter duraquae]TDO24920.1 hypothetical protein CLV32_1215 [Pedobacter duraquae]